MPNPFYKRALFSAGLAHFIHDGLTDMLYIFFPLWQTQFLLSFAEIGFLKTIFSGAMALGQIPASYLAQKAGSIRLLLLGTLLTSTSFILYQSITSPLLLFLLLLLGGLGSSVQHPLSSSIITTVIKDPYPRRIALSTFNLAGDVGKLIMPGLAAAIIHISSSWQQAAFFCGLLGLLGTGILGQSTRALVLENPPQKATTAPASTSAAFPPAFWALLLIGIIDSSTRMGFLTFFPFLLQANAASIGTIGLALSLVFAGGATGKFFCGALAAKAGALPTVIFTELLTAACIFSILYLPLPIQIALSFFLGIALNGTSSVLYGSVPELVCSEKYQQAFAIFYTGTIAAGAVSPWIYGVLSDFLGMTAAIIIIAGMVLSILPLTAFLRGKISA
ncbi:MAG: MFS transporter [Selenomonadaceae bacterium]